MNLYLCKLCGCVIYPVSATLQETEGHSAQRDKRQFLLATSIKPWEFVQVKIAQESKQTLGFCKWAQGHREYFISLLLYHATISRLPDCTADTSNNRFLLPGVFCYFLYETWITSWTDVLLERVKANTVIHVRDETNNNSSKINHNSHIVKLWSKKKHGIANCPK